MRKPFNIVTPQFIKAALVGLVWTAFFWRVLTPTEADRLTFQQGDFTLQFLAYRQLAYAQLTAGRLPSIEECLYAGHPFIADPQSQLFYAPVLVIMLLGRLLGWSTYPLRALEWEVMAHSALALFGMYVFLRGHMLRRSAAVFGGFAFAFSGALTGYAMLQTAILETAAWMPLILHGLHRLAAAPERWWRLAAGTAALTAIAFTAGHPQTMLFIAYTGVIAFVWWSRSRSFTRIIAPRGIAVGALAIGLSAVQLLPTLWFMLNSTRTGLSFDAAGRGFALHDIALFILTGVTNAWQPLHVGIVTLALCAYALLNRTFADTRLWSALALGALVLSFGANAFGFDLAYLAAPGYRQFQSQERHAIVVAFCLSTLGALGLEKLNTRLVPRLRLTMRRWGARILLIALLSYGATLAVLVFGAAIEPPRPDIATIASRLGLITLGCLGLGLLLRWRAQHAIPTYRNVWMLGMLALLIFELFTANRLTALGQPSEPFPPLALLKPIKDAQTQRATAPFERVYNHYGLPLNAACVNGLREIAGGSPIVWRDYRRFLAETPEAVMVRLLNVRYAVTWRGAMTTPEGAVIPTFLLARDVFEGNEASLYRLEWEPADTRGAWIGKPEGYASDDDIFKRMREPDFDPFAHTPMGYSAGDLTYLAGNGSAAVEGRAPGYIKIAVNVDAIATVSVSEAYHPNWIALVNGRPTRPIKVYGALIGVPVPKGASTIEMSYQPLDVYIGAAISGLTALIALALAVRQGTRTVPTTIKSSLATTPSFDAGQRSPPSES